MGKGGTLICFDSTFWHSLGHSIITFQKAQSHISTMVVCSSLELVATVEEAVSPKALDLRASNGTW